MKVKDEYIVEAILDHYRNVSGGFDLDSPFAIDKFERVVKILSVLDGEGFSDLEVLRLAIAAMVLQILNESKTP